MKKLVFILLALVTFFIACDEDDELSYQEQLAKDIEKIQDYLEEKGLTAESNEHGLYYIIEEEGTGSSPTVDSIVKVRYSGYYLNDKVFDSGTIEGKLTGFILGWQEGLPLFKEGGSGMLFVPSSLGYGIYDYYGIPKNSVLIFEVDLLEVTED